jgi:hypothetical protein
MKYKCECCNYSTDDKSNFNKHIISKKHKLVESKSMVSPGKSKVSPVPEQTIPIINSVGNENFSCKYCGQKYKHKQSVTKHIKYSCNKNKTEDLTELVRLLNLQLEQQKKQLEHKDNQLEHKDKQLETQSKQIEKLMDKLEINTYNTNSNNTTINNVVNVNLLNYDQTDTSHLTDKDYEKCIKHVYDCVVKMIEKVHFNPEKPENMNLYISNIKSNHIMMYKDNKWLLVNNAEVESIYADKDNLIHEWIEENKIKDTELLGQFNKCTNMDESSLKRVYDKVKLLLFNQRDVVRKQIKN